MYQNIMKLNMTTITYILIAFALIVIILYYTWHSNRSFETSDKLIPYDILHQPDITIVDILKNVSNKYGHYTALKYKINGKWKTMTYSEYFNKSSVFAENLLYLLGPHSRVGILGNNCIEWFIVHIGTMISGCIPIGIDPKSPNDHTIHITNHSCIDLIFVGTADYLGNYYNTSIPTVKYILTLGELDTNNEIEMDYVNNIKSNNPHILFTTYAKFSEKRINHILSNTCIDTKTIFPEDMATIIYTPDPNNLPKGVVITHKNIICALISGIRIIQSHSKITIDMQERYISHLPLSYISTQIMDIYVPMATVGTVHFQNLYFNNDMDNKLLFDTVREIQPTIFVGVPRIWESLMDDIKKDIGNSTRLLNKLLVNKIIIHKMGLDKAKYCITTSGTIRYNVYNFFHELGIELCDVYGMNETCGPISMAVPGFSKGSGKPTIDIKIDKHTSEIMVRGCAVFKEYYKDKQATQDAFIKKWFKTGNIGYIDRDGTLYVTGIMKEIIILSDNTRIEPVAIEEKILNILNKQQNIFSYVVLVGHKRKCLSLLLIPSSHYTKNYKTVSIIEDMLQEINVDGFWIGRYYVADNIDKECTTHDGKLNRKLIHVKYMKYIDKLYE